ncbi:hypothetical protein HGM15179_018912 [Zosterops borbonicus]|uniref:Endonuclease/exonuclease/phosphatase domain-containing protein n=1 Tax=Zosterops borbonicus TaxID=364589 RepID=A0A8K1FYS0_9PASS|nr:hypothetical protein HGM15179_018912 [Zosterops borbonicus]
MGNKQELEATMLLESYDLVAITETCEELSLKNSHEQVKSLWVRTRDQGNKGNLVVGVYYRPPDQGEPIDKAFLLQLQETLHLQALILLGDFNYPNICWESSMATCWQSRRLLECMDNNFLSQVIDSTTREDVLLDLLVTNASELIRNVKIGGSLGCSDHTLVEFAVLRDMGQVMVGPPDCQGTLLTHIQLAVDQNPQVLVSYEETQWKMGLFGLEKRKLRGDVINTYKHLKDSQDCSKIIERPSDEISQLLQYSWMNPIRPYRLIGIQMEQIPHKFRITWELIILTAMVLQLSGHWDPPSPSPVLKTVVV